MTLRFLLLPQLLRLRDEGYDVAAISAPGPWVQSIEDQGIRHISWNHATRSWDPLADARALAELMEILRRGRFHLVHTHNPKPGVMGRMAAWLVGTPVVANTVHGLYATPQDGYVKRLGVLGLERIAAACSSVEFYQSEEDLIWARSIGLVSRERSVLLGNGVDLSVFDSVADSAHRSDRTRSELGISKDAVVVGTVGRLVAEKGYREFFTAAHLVRRRAPQVRFLIAGERDPHKRDSVSLEEIERASEDVIFAGWRDDVRDLLAAMDVFALPSWREGLPRSAIEAAAMGCAMVLTDIRGCREVVRDGVEGFLVPPRDAGSLARGILQLVGDRGLREQMGKAARARAEERFDERRVLGTVVDSYRRILRTEGIEPPAAKGGAVRVRPARSTDPAMIARLHRMSMPDAFLSTLGIGFLRQLYRAMVGDREVVVLVADDGDGVVGFAAGTLSVRSFFRRFAAGRGLWAALIAIPSLLRRGVLRRMRELAMYPETTSRLPDAELLAIAVSPMHRSAGVGSKLARGLLGRLADRGAGEVKVLVGAENADANRFYEGLGFRYAARGHVHDGVESNVWVTRCRS